MDILNLDEFPTSILFHNYKEKIIAETNRSILMRIKNNDRFNYPALFIPNSTVIEIHVKHGLWENVSEFETIIAHEMTHGLLHYKYKYNFLKVNIGSYMTIAGIIQTMIQDISVQKMISEYGFTAIPPNIESGIKGKIEMLKQRVPLEFIFQSSDPLIKSWSIIHDMILMWGHLKYVLLLKDQCLFVGEYLRTLQSTAPYLVTSFDYIVDLLNNNDVFTSDGYNTIVGLIIKKWNLPLMLVSDI